MSAPVDVLGVLRGLESFARSRLRMLRNKNRGPHPHPDAVVKIDRVEYTLGEAASARSAVAELIDSMPALIEIAACRAPVSLGAIRRAEAALARVQGERA